MTTTTNEPTADPIEWGPLTLHIRRQRQWYCDEGLSQAELAKLAGISPRLLRSLETCRALPQSLDALLRVAIALQLPVEALIDPRHIARLRAGIDVRRDQRDEDEEAPRYVR